MVSVTNRRKIILFVITEPQCKIQSLTFSDWNDCYIFHIQSYQFRPGKVSDIFVFCEVYKVGTVDSCVECYILVRLFQVLYGFRRFCKNQNIIIF